MNEKAIEAAAQALFDRECARCVARDNEPHHKPGTLVKNMPHSYRDDYEKDAQAMLTAAASALPPLRAREEIDDEKLARIIAQADFIWDLGEQGVMACSPDLAGKMFDEAWADAKSSTRQKFLHIAQAVLALSSPTGQEWRDISSAPKDGTRIWLGDAEKIVTGYWSPPVGAWRCDWLVGKAGDKPTHWMPLPAPPVAEPIVAEQETK